MSAKLIQKLLVSRGFQDMKATRRQSLSTCLGEGLQASGRLPAWR